MADRTVLITGASTGIGTACVVRLAGNGWRVYAGVRRPEDGDRLNRLTSAVGGTVTPIRLDVTVDDDVRAALDRIDDDVGSLDGLVN
ncbi:MAG: SDR family NAD(P)-dependent oxidoreductase, partial [Actinomycetota bacterium]